VCGEFKLGGVLGGVSTISSIGVKKSVIFCDILKVDMNIKNVKKYIEKKMQ
jgi:hypothetical protein